MTLIEYGKLDVKMVEGKPELIILCTAPAQLLEKISQINNINIDMIMTKDSKVFIDIPGKLFETAPGEIE